MNRIGLCLMAVVLCASKLVAAPLSADKEVWGQEKAYWHYVQTDDLKGYRSLWHANFLGWPSLSPEPLGKEHITDWITVHEKKGETLKSYDVEQLSIQVTGNVATTTYRAHTTWLSKSGTENTGVTRIIHTWLHDRDGSWHIISGMSAPVNAEGH